MRSRVHFPLEDFNTLAAFLCSSRSWLFLRFAFRDAAPGFLLDFDPEPFCFFRCSCAIGGCVRDLFEAT